MTNESQAMMSHYVGNWLMKVTMCLEEGNADEAEHWRNDLVGKLKGLEQDPVVDECISTVESYRWDDKDGLESFRNAYQQIESKSELPNMADVVKTLFGN